MSPAARDIPKMLPLRGPLLALAIFILVSGLGLRIWAATGNEFPTVDGVLYLDQTFEMVNNGYLPWSCFPPGWRYLGLIGRNLGIFLPKLFGILGLPMVLLAAWGMVKGRGPWLWLLAPLLPVPFIINPMDVRFWIPYLPVIVLAAGLGGLHLAGLPWFRPRWKQIALLAVLLTGLVAASWDDAYWIKRNREAFYGLRDAGAWLKDKTDSDTVLAAYKPYTSYWAGCSFLKYPAEMDAAEIAVWARHQGVSYLVVNVAVAYALAPNLKPFLETPLPPELAGRVSRAHLLRYEAAQLNTVIYKVER